MAVHGECSFTPDTEVATEDGSTPISELEIGDEVLAYNEETGEVNSYTVTAIHIHTDDKIAYLTINDELIITTPDHPFYSEDRGWLGAGELEIGEPIRTSDGSTGAVTSLEVVTEPQDMWNLTVDEAHTFFVGDGELK
ncbi:MAG: polymorphic toxin-type HINT domain-containing protein [Aggregatilineales bacterium]